MEASIQITIIAHEQPRKDILVALLSDMGFDGFEEERNNLKAFMPAGDFDEPGFAQFAAAEGFVYSTEIIAPTNWNSIWESGYKPVLVDDFCVVRASFHERMPGVEHDIIINPKMSFGTGHHATTFMMIQAMSSIDFSNKTVFDFGTGTGVLAILAVKLGAANVTAIDNDEQCIENAAENIAQNSCAGEIELYKDTTVPKDKKFDIILANINRGIILQNLARMQQHLLPKGVILISGLLATDRQIIMKEVQKAHLQLVREFEKDGWICLVLDNL